MAHSLYVANEIRGLIHKTQMHSVNRSLHSSFTEPRIGQPEVTVGSWSRIIVVAILDYSSFLSESSTAGTFCLKMMLMCHQWISSKIVLRRKETVRWTSLKTHCPQVLKAVHESGRKRLSTWKIGNVKARCMQPPLVSYLVSYRHYIRQPRCRCYEIKWPPIFRLLGRNILTPGYCVSK